MSQLSEKILELHRTGFSYKEICKILNCSKGNVSYHCGKGQKQKTLNRTYKLRKKEPLLTKVEFFLRKETLNTQSPSKDIIINSILNKKIKIYSYLHKNKKGNRMFTVKDLKNKIGDNPKCYLTGRSIDLSKPSTYHLDHIIPRSRGGDNSLDNCNIACKHANMAKGEMLLDEFYKLCEDVLNNKK